MKWLAIVLALGAAGCEGASQPVLVVDDVVDGERCGPRSRCDGGPRDAGRIDANPPMARDGSWDYADAGDDPDAYPGPVDAGDGSDAYPGWFDGAVDTGVREDAGP